MPDIKKESSILEPIHELCINHLEGALRSCLEATETAVAKNYEVNPGDYFAGILTGWLGQGDMRIRFPPVVDFRQKVFEFRTPHVIRAEQFSVVRSPMRTGIAVPVLLQIWLDTPKQTMEFGIPLSFALADPHGRIDPFVWSEMHKAARILNHYTSATRFIFLGELKEAPLKGFMPHPDRIHFLSSTYVESMPEVPRRIHCPIPYAAVTDLASGWIGDAALSGRHPSGFIDHFMTSFDITSVVRVIIEPQGKIWSAIRPQGTAERVNKT